MKHFTNTELNEIVTDMIQYMTMYDDKDLEMYARQYSKRRDDIQVHSAYYMDDPQIQEEIHDDYIELIRTIRKTLDAYYYGSYTWGKSYAWGKEDRYTT